MHNNDKNEQQIGGGASIIMVDPSCFSTKHQRIKTFAPLKHNLQVINNEQSVVHILATM